MDPYLYSPCVDLFHYLLFLPGLFQPKPTLDSILAFQSFLLIAPAPPVYPGYESFTSVVNYYLEGPPFSFYNPYRSDGKEKIVSIPFINVLLLTAPVCSEVLWMVHRGGNCIVRGLLKRQRGTNLSSLVENGFSHFNTLHFTSVVHLSYAIGNFPRLTRIQIHLYPTFCPVYRTKLFE